VRTSAGRDFEPVFLHDGRAMIVDRALADAQVCGNVLAGVAGEDEV
jgi:hypothetical protein